MNFSESFLRVANSILTVIVSIVFLTIGAYATYALWDNNTVYSAARNVQEEMLELKPGINEASFEELLEINPDVRAWVTLDGTNIDYPVLQGKTNLSYINTDVYGDFALAGSIFLDSRNDGNFNDTYSLLYGHYMDNNKMFGDLSLYKDEIFFRENQTGTLILPDRVYKLEIYACLLVTSSEGTIFNPEMWQGEIDELIQFTKNNALYLNDNVVDKRIDSVDKDPQILALTTCTTEYTDARTVVLAVMVP